MPSALPFLMIWSMNSSYVLGFSPLRASYWSMSILTFILAMLATLVR